MEQQKIINMMVFVSIFWNVSTIILIFTAENRTLDLIHARQALYHWVTYQSFEIILQWRKKIKTGFKAMSIKGFHFYFCNYKIHTYSGYTVRAYLKIYMHIDIYVQHRLLLIGKAGKFYIKIYIYFRFFWNFGSLCSKIFFFLNLLGSL